MNRRGFFGRLCAAIGLAGWAGYERPPVVCEQTELRVFVNNGDGHWVQMPLEGDWQFIGPIDA